MKRIEEISTCRECAKKPVKFRVTAVRGFFERSWLVCADCYLKMDGKAW